MAILSSITLYPIKSCAGMSVDAATLTRAGLEVGPVCDREWMLVDPDGHFLTQREHPRMALIVPSPGAQALEVRAPGMAMLEVLLALPGVARPGVARPGVARPSVARPVAATRMVQVWDDRVPAFDCGDMAAAWFSTAIGTACRLVRFDPACARQASAAWTGGVAAPTRFADGFPLLAIGAASLLDLNLKLLAAGRAQLPMNRFRPNLVFDGIEAFDEDVAESFRLGAMLLKPVKPCARCTIPSLDQATGQAGPDPLDLLRSYRTKPELDGAICFGMNCIVVEGERQMIAVGQQVELTLAFS
jgi:uncharacterized protein YcbX